MTQQSPPFSPHYRKVREMKTRGWKIKYRGEVVLHPLEPQHPLKPEHPLNLVYLEGKRDGDYDGGVGRRWR